MRMRYCRCQKMRYELPGLIGNIIIESNLWLVYLKTIYRAPMKGWPSLGGFQFLFSCDTAGRAVCGRNKTGIENYQNKSLFTMDYPCRLSGRKHRVLWHLSQNWMSNMKCEGTGNIPLSLVSLVGGKAIAFLGIGGCWMGLELCVMW